MGTNALAAAPSCGVNEAVQGGESGWIPGQLTEHKQQTLEVSGWREIHQNNISRLLIIWLLPLLHTSCCTQDLTLSYFLTSSTSWPSSWSSSSSPWPSQLTFTVSADPRPRAEHVTQTNRNHNPDWDDPGSVDQRNIKKINRKLILLFFCVCFMV